MEFYAPAKLNLCLDVLQKTTRGYHEIRTVFYEYTPLKNKITINETAKPANNPPQQSLAHRAYTLLKNTYEIDRNLSIKIIRNIPPNSGLGGESSNAATILKALNQLWKLKLTTEQLKKHAAQLGMDVPFFIEGGTAVGTHYGEIIEQLPHHELPIKVYIKSIPTTPDFGVGEAKTAKAYAALNLELCGLHTAKTDALITAVKSKNLEKIGENLHNDFETLTPPPKNHHLSGSGPSFFTFGLPTKT